MLRLATSDTYFIELFCFFILGLQSIIDLSNNCYLIFTGILILHKIGLNNRFTEKDIVFFSASSNLSC